MAELKQTIDLRRTEGFDAAVKVVATNPGDALYGQHAGSGRRNGKRRKKFVAESKKRRSDFNATLSETTIISSLVLALVLTGLVGWYISSSMTRQIGSAAALLQSSSGELQAAANQQSPARPGRQPQ